MPRLTSAAARECPVDPGPRGPASTRL